MELEGLEFPSQRAGSHIQDPLQAASPALISDVCVAGR
jgi:hypothetical protein